MTLFVLLALALITTALLAVATHEFGIVRAHGDVLAARLAAESGGRAAVASWRTSEFADLPIGAERSVDDAPDSASSRLHHDVVVERLSDTLFLVRSEGRAGPGPAVRRAGLIVRGIHPFEPWSEFPAAVTTAGELRLGPGARVSGYGVSPVGCPPEAATDLIRLFGGVDRPGALAEDPALLSIDPAAELEGEPAVLVDAAAAAPEVPPRLGPLGRHRLEHIADRVEQGSLALQPEAGEDDCLTDAPGNWGDPQREDGPCSDHAPLVFSPGDLTITEGAGQGVLVVAGDLTLGAGVVFHGAVRVGGRILLGDQASIRGAVRIDGKGASPSELAAGSIDYDACALWRAFRQAPALDRPFRPSRRMWVPVF